MSYSIQQIQTQNAEFDRALAEGRISQADYDRVMVIQNGNMALAVARQRAEAVAIETAQDRLSSVPVMPGNPDNPTEGSWANVAPAPQPEPTLAPSPSLSQVSYVTRGGEQAFVNPLPTSGVPNVKDVSWQNLTPAGQTQIRQDAIATAAVVALPVAVVAAPEAALIGMGIGAVSNPIIAQGFKAYSGQGWLTPEEALGSVGEGALVGGILGPVGQGANSVLRIGGAGLKSAAGRIGVNTLMGAGLGAGGEYVATGKVTPTGVGTGAAFGAAFSFAGEGLGRFSQTRVGTRINERVFGVKFNEIKGANEIYEQVTYGERTYVTRLTEPELASVHLRGNDARFYREYNLGTLRDPKLELAGSQRIKTFTNEGGLQEVTRYNQPIESTRPAEPVLSAIKGEEFVMGKVKAGRLGEMVKSPSDLPAVEKVQVRAGRGNVSLDGIKRSDSAVTLLEKEVVTKPGAVLPESLVASRRYTGVQLKGTVDPQVYAATAKALPDEMAQEIYQKLGGGTKQGSSFFDVKTPRVKGTKPLWESKGSIAKVPEEARGTGAKPVAILKDVTKSEEVTLPRAIVGEVKTSSVPKLRFSGALSINRMASAQDEEVQVLSYPKSGLATPNQIQAPVVGQRQSQQQRSRINFMPKQEPIVNPITIPKVTPFEAVKTTPKEAQKLSPITVPKVTPRQTSKTTPFIPEFPKVPTRARAFNPAFALGGGSGRSSGGSLFGGSWGKKQRRIKTPKEMLATFGLKIPERRRKRKR